MVRNPRNRGSDRVRLNRSVTKYSWLNHSGEYYTCQEGIIVLEKKCTAGLYYYDPCNEDTTDNDIQAKCGFGMFLA